MSTRNQIRAAASAVYVAALVIGLAAGGLAWIAIIGAVALAILYTALRGPVKASGRARNRNRNRNRT